MKKQLFFFLLLPFTLFSQSAVIKSFSPISKHDTIRHIEYPFIICMGQPFNSTVINNAIKAVVFNNKEYDTTQSLQKLLNALYKKDTALKIGYTVTYNKNGLLSITITTIPAKGDRKPNIHLNFDLSAGKPITISEMIKTKNDSFSLRQAIIPVITDSIRLFEQTIDINNPNYSNIIEWLNVSLSKFMQYYPTNYSLTDTELTVYFDCFMPSMLLPYCHTYRVSFSYNVFKNTFKANILNKLL